MFIFVLLHVVVRIYIFFLSYTVCPALYGASYHGAQSQFRSDIQDAPYCKTHAKIDSNKNVVGKVGILVKRYVALALVLHHSVGRSAYRSALTNGTQQIMVVYSLGVPYKRPLRRFLKKL